MKEEKVAFQGYKNMWSAEIVVVWACVKYAQNFA